MTSSNRRVFMIHCVAASSALAALPAQASERKLLETDPQAVALGYRDDTKNVDAKKYPKHSPSQTCTGCLIWKGVTADGGTCHVFAKRLLSGAGWCSQYSAKA